MQQTIGLVRVMCAEAVGVSLVVFRGAFYLHRHLGWLQGLPWFCFISPKFTS